MLGDDVQGCCEVAACAGVNREAGQNSAERIAQNRTELSWVEWGQCVYLLSQCCAEHDRTERGLRRVSTAGLS